MVRNIAGAAIILAVAAAGFMPPAQAQVTPATGPATKPPAKPTAPAELPGKGLAQHEFFYAGESPTQNMYIVKSGKVTWEYHGAAGAKGEISDAALLSTGNILFAHQFGVTLIDADKKVLWNHDAPAKTEIHTAQMIGKDKVLFVQNGAPAKVIVMNITDDKVVTEFEVPVKNPNTVHGHFREGRLTDAGTLLLAHMDLGKVAEYDSKGKEIWANSPGFNIWSARRLPNGNTLICGAKVREIDPQGAKVWEFSPADVPEYKFDSLQTATRLANGNTLINNWVNAFGGKVDVNAAPVQALEISPDKKVVWALRAWGDPVNLGPSTIIQLLDGPIAPETAHFGDIK